MGTSELRTIAFIFARGGSKGLLGKNIKSLGGEPLIAHAIKVGLATPSIETVIVSTDDPAIAEIALAYGAEVPFVRPTELAQDQTPEWLAWRHAIAWFEENRGPFGVFLSLPPTSPFRSVSDVQACIDALNEDVTADMAITVTGANRSPYFNMVTTDENGYANLVIKPVRDIARRQDAPEVFDITTVAYAARPSFVLMADHIFNGRVKAVIVPRERALDIDTPFDFMLAEAIAAARWAHNENTTEERN